MRARLAAATLVALALLTLAAPAAARQEEEPAATLALDERSPWVSDSEVEDSLLSLQIKSAGYLTKISARARAHVGGMTTLRSLDAFSI